MAHTSGRYKRIGDPSLVVAITRNDSGEITKEKSQGSEASDARILQAKTCYAAEN